MTAFTPWAEEAKKRIGARGIKEGSDLQLLDWALDERDSLLDALRVCRDTLLAYDGSVIDPKRADSWSDPEAHAVYLMVDAALAKATTP